ncbi:MAG: pyruvate kinase [Bernardetiaceae bacterium]|nr:pyruvate kinase [Bernardetiaceae bacterium]
MPVKTYDNLLNELLIVRRQMLSLEQAHAATIAAVHPAFRKSAANLIHYLAFRSVEVRFIQDKLHDLGLSSLASGELHLFDQLNKVIGLLAHLSHTHVKPAESVVDPLDYPQGRALLAQHTDKLFGTFSDDGRIRIMVTLPSEAAHDPDLVLRLAQNGLNIARINTAHDTPDDWQRMIDHLNLASHQTNRPIKIFMDLAGPKLRTAGIIDPENPAKAALKLHPGDELLIHQDLAQASPPQFGPDGQRLGPAVIATTLPQMIADLRPGEPIFFDDGKFAGRITEKTEAWVKVVIENAPARKNGLKNDRGINLPQTQLSTPSLTARDLEILPFVARHAHLVGYSFVRTAAEVAQLQQALEQHAKPGKAPYIVLKIEKQEAVQNLPSLLLAGMAKPTFGVMIARGDLAVEVGFARLSEVQQEILWLCEAAHVPVVWATQVLESLAKQGLASRSEISDAAQAAQAECVMLNKGPYIDLALQTLDNVLRRMRNHLSKKRYTLRPLGIAQRFVNQGEVD